MLFTEGWESLPGPMPQDRLLQYKSGQLWTYIRMQRQAERLKLLGLGIGSMSFLKEPDPPAC